MYFGEKVMLRAYKKEDIEKACEFMNDFDTRRLMTPAVPFPFMLEQEAKWYESLLNNKDSYNFAIEDIESKKYIGGCGVNHIDWTNRIATVGIFIGEKDFRDKGYGTDAMKALIRFIFEQMNVNKIKLNVFSFNPRAKRCYEKCGFVLEGTLRQELFRDGKYHDEYVMSILLDEWKNTAKN